MMRFEEDLFQAFTQAFPATTVRSFSKTLGMSEGYWSSIMAQGLKVSNTALCNLSEHLEACKIMVATGNPRAKHLRTIQRMITREVVRRFAKEADSFDGIWDAVTATTDQAREVASASYGAMPFVMVRT